MMENNLKRRRRNGRRTEKDKKKKGGRPPKNKNLFLIPPKLFEVQLFCDNIVPGEPDLLKAPSVFKVTTTYPSVLSGSPKLCQIVLV